MSDINTNTRLFDLVRFMRSELHLAHLITNDEYAWLSYGSPMNKGGGSPSVRRLQDYDNIRKELATVTAERDALMDDKARLLDALQRARTYISAVNEDCDEDEERDELLAAMDAWDKIEFAEKCEGHVKTMLGMAESCLDEIRALMPKEWECYELPYCVMMLRGHTHTKDGQAIDVAKEVRGA